MKRTRVFLSLAVFAFLNLSLLPAQMPGGRHHEQNDKDSYRGRRMMPNPPKAENATVFFIEAINAKENHDYIVIQLFFNQPIDPLSLKPENILINGKPPIPKPILKFGRMGNMLQILLPLSETSAYLKESVFEIQINEILSYNGLSLQKNLFSDIRCGKHHTFTE